MSQERYNPDAHRPHRTFEEAARQQYAESCRARVLSKPYPRSYSDGVSYAAAVQEYNSAARQAPSKTHTPTRSIYIDIEDHPAQRWNA